jgi:type I restriction-modification system DNA methylase subunit/restriction endonuclease S subunit
MSNIIFEYINNDQKDNKKLLSLIDKAHNILYNSENISGENALNDIMNFLFLKMLEPIISDKEEEGKIDIFNKKYYKDLYDNKTLDIIFKYFNINELCKCELKDLRDMNSSNDVIRQIGDILITHPITKMIYTKNNFINAKKSTTIQNLLDVIKNINLNEFKDNEDIIGDIYEHFINGYAKMKGSMLGQFFTPRKLMKLILNYKKEHIEELINNSGESFKIYDSCMGTGGWIISGYNMFKSDKILLSGGEVEPRTFQFGLMNLISTLHKFPYDVQCESSLTHVNNKKHNLILTNPPFKTSFPFKQLEINFKEDKYNKMKLDDIYTLKNNNPPIQFLELNYYKLEENGVCIIVLPYGELFFGSKFKKSREHFMNTFNITDIILMPSGIFTHADVKTCVLIFQKNGKTKEIKFSESNQECTQIRLIKNVNINKIKKNKNFSWYINDYIKHQIIKVNENIEIKTLGEIFNIDKGTLQSTKNTEGEYTFITASDDYKTHHTYTHDCECILFVVGAEGSLAKTHYYNGKFIASDLLLILQRKTNTINYKYMWYYLNNNRQKYLLDETICCGTPKKQISIERCSNIKIHIPSIEKQNKIVEHLDFIEKNIINTQNIILQYNKLNEIYLNNQKTFDYNINKKLAEISIINPENMKSGQYTEINYIDIASVKGGQILELQNLSNDFPSRAKRIVKKGDILYSSVRPNLKGYVYISDDINNGIASTGFAQIRVKDPNVILSKYLYYVMTTDFITNELVNKAKGAQYPAVSFDDFENLDILVPSIEIQNKIVEYCDHNNNLINELNKMIDNNKLLMKDIITNL